MRARIQELLREQKEDVKLKALRHFYLGKTIQLDNREVTIHQITKKGNTYIFGVSIQRTKNVSAVSSPEDFIYKIKTFFGVQKYSFIPYTEKEMAAALKGKSFKLKINDLNRNPGWVIIKFQKLQLLEVLLEPRFWYRVSETYGKATYSVFDINEKIQELIQKKFGILVRPCYKNGSCKYNNSWEYFENLPEIF